MKTKLGAAIALILATLASFGAACAADLGGAQAPGLVGYPSTPARTWTGPYVGIGAGWDIENLEVEGVDGAFAADDPSAYARLGYRFQPSGSRIVIGAYVEGGISALSVDDEIDATYRLLLGGDVGLTLGSLLVSVDGGYAFSEGDGKGFTLATDGPYVGLKGATDIGGGYALEAGWRRYFLEGDEGGLDIDQGTNSVTAGVSVRF